MIRISSLKVPAGSDTAHLRKKAAHILGIRTEALLELEILKKSRDARKRSSVLDVYTIAVRVDNEKGVLARCRDEHIKIPEDLRVASFYNSSILESAIPSVTSLNFNDRNLGAVAAKTLLDIIDNVPVTSKMLGGYEVILKESTK